MAVQHLETAQDIRAAFGLQEPQAEPQTAHERPAAAEQRHDAAETPPVRLPPIQTSLKLSRSYEVKGITFDHLCLQPPRGVDYWTLGEPYDFMPARDGAPAVYVEHVGVIRSYAEICVKPEAKLGAVDMIEALDIRDSRALKGAVLGFFTAPVAGSV